MKTFRRKTHLLYGNPPCAPFSPIGGAISKKEGWRGDPRLECWDNLIDVVEVVQPRVFVGESVPRFYTAGWPLLQSYARRLLKGGYQVYVVQHDIKFLGAAQQRRRVFLIGSRYDLTFPTPTFPRRDLSDALSEVDDPGVSGSMYDEVAECLHVMPQGMGLKDFFFEYYGGEEHVRELGLHRPRFVEGRLRLNEPTGTVFGNTMIHPTEDRYLGINEYLNLLGYPPEYKWAADDVGGIMGEAVKAVTSFAARYVAQVVKAGIERGKVIRNPRAIEVKRWSTSTRRISYDLTVEDTDITDRVWEDNDGETNSS